MYIFKDIVLVDNELNMKKQKLIYLGHGRHKEWRSGGEKLN